MSKFKKRIMFLLALFFDWTRGNAVPKLLNIDVCATVGSNPETLKTFLVYRR